jgi:predicted esterase
MRRARVVWVALVLLSAACASEGASDDEVTDAGMGAPDADVDAADEVPEPSEDAGAPLLQPIIPERDGECPELSTGTHEIMGLNTGIIAGEPSAVKGPLLFTWHGTGGTGDLALAQVPQSVKDDIIAQGGLIIAPSDNGEVREGQDVTFVLGVWYDLADLAYADHIVACAVENHNIDPRRIYVTGCSAGGLMAGVMSLLRSSYVAAAAPNSGGVAATTYALEDPERVPAIMTMHGGANDNVIVNFGSTSANLASIVLPQGGFVVDCNHMVGHCRAPVELHERAWDFMQAHPFGYPAPPYADGLPAEFPDYCAIKL